MSSKKGTVLSPFEHAYHRPDTYIGSVTTALKSKWVAKDEIVFEEIRYNPGLFNIFRELGSNIIDNKWRSENDPDSPSMGKIVIKTDLETGEISFWNDGYCIPVHKETYTFSPFKKESYTMDLYPAEVFFGQMGAGTNFNDSEERKTSGRNGMGAKLVNIFSTEFIVEHTCLDDGKKFVQKHSANGTKSSPPKVTKYSRKTGYTKITFTPDYEYFNYPTKKEPGLDDNLVGLLKMYAYEIAMLTGVPVHFNGRKLAIKNLEQYCRLFYPDKSKHHMARLEVESGDECVIVEGETPDMDDMEKIKHVSFVNGIQTSSGGIHVDAWENCIITQFVKFFNSQKPKKGKEPLPKASGKQIKPYLMLFIRVEIDKPQFGTQTKDQLTGPCDSKGKPAYKIRNTKEFKLRLQTIFKKMLRWNFICMLEDKLLAKIQNAQKRQEGSTRHVRGKSVTDANKAGTKESSECILCIAEGMSAKGFVDCAIGSIRKDSNGREKNGTDYYGSMAIKGKFMNVQNASQVDVNKNTEIQLLKEMLGLRSGMDYSKDENFKTLRYGKVWIIADADDDGIHIRGLLVNFFYRMYPSLIERNYIEAFNTAVVKVSWGSKKKKERLLFYSNPDFAKWYKNRSNASKINVEYYKGLGSIPKPEGPAYFRDPKVVTYFVEGDDKEYMDLGFDDQSRELRKEWITRNMPFDEELRKWYDDDSSEGVSLSDLDSEGEVEAFEEPDFVYEGMLSLSCFVDHQLIIYHKMSLRRALPCIWDGFKEGQRKIMFAVRKAKLKKPQVLERIGGMVGQVTGYHHGANSLLNAIVKMAQGFVGSNNIPLFTAGGNFGSRLAGGKDIASPRYPKSMLEEIVHVIFPDVDDPLLTRLKDGDDEIEYSTFMPVICMLLVNGAKGMGCGFSTDIPCYNPKDIVQWTEAWLDDPLSVKELEPLKPWYNGYIGKIELTPKGETPTGWTSEGILEKDRKGWWHIRELPIGLWPNVFKEWLEYLETGIAPKGKRWKKSDVKCIKEIKNYNTANTVHFMIKPTREFIPDMTVSGNLKILKKTYSLKNMVVIDEKDYPYRFKSPEQILECFCRRRLKFYGLRREYYLRAWKKDLIKASNRYKFVKEVGIKRSLDLHSFSSNEELYEYMETQFQKVDDSFDYLLSMQMRSLTKKRADELKKESLQIKQKISNLQSKTGKDLWREDLENFKVAYEKFLLMDREE